MKYLGLITLVFLALIIKIKAGNCPKTPEYGCNLCRDYCYGDEDCHGGRSCCKESCGNVCRIPPKTNAGTPSQGYTCGYCPAPAYVACKAEDGCYDECGPQKPCGFGLVCCSEICGNKCRAQSMYKEGKLATAAKCPPRDPFTNRPNRTLCQQGAGLL